MKTKQLTLSLALLLASGTLLSSCGPDPLEAKETALARRPQSEGLLTTTQHYDFTEWLETDDGYMLPKVSESDSPSSTYWASASNLGYTLLAGGDKSSFPVRPLTVGQRTEGALIRTVRGFYIPGLGSHVVAGSLYTGSIDRSKLISSSLESSLFGQPYRSGIPEQLKFRYQYKSGATVIHGQEKAVALPPTDKGSVTIALYEVTDNTKYLDGLTLQTDPRIVAKGYMELEATPEEQWQDVTLRLQVVDAARYRSVDFTNKRYRLALVFSSSYRGAEFIGAIGSELKLQDVRIQDRVKTN